MLDVNLSKNYDHRRYAVYACGLQTRKFFRRRLPQMPNLNCCTVSLETAIAKTKIINSNHGGRNHLNVAIKCGHGK